MKKTVLIVILSIVILLLSATLYLFIETAPKDIKHEEAGTLYSLGEISFNLSSSEYVENTVLTDAIIERGDDPEQMKGWVDENENNGFIVLYRDNDEVFDEKLLFLKNPINHLRLEMELPKEEEYQELGIYMVDLDYYLGPNKVGILEKNYKNDESISYQFEIKIGDLYYIVIAQQSETHNLALENIMEFMRTVNINK